MKLKVEGHPNLVRDSGSKAIINIDKDAYREHVAKKNLHSKVINMDEEISELKTSVDEIKQLLFQILQRIK